MLRTTTTSLLLVFALPLAAGAQTWSQEEQSAIDHILACWNQSDAKEDWEEWKRVCNPADDMTYWWTSMPAPVEGHEYWGKLHEARWKNNSHTVAYEMLPYRVKLYGDIAALYFYSVGRSQDAAGEVTDYANYRLESRRPLASPRRHGSSHSTVSEFQRA